MRGNSPTVNGELQVKIDGQAKFNGVYQMLTAALDGCGLAFVPEDLAAAPR